MDLSRNKKLISLILASIFIVLFLSLAGYFANKYFGIFRQKITFSNPLAPKTTPKAVNTSKSEGGALSLPSQVITLPTTRFAIDIGPKQIGSVTARLKFKPGPWEIKLGIRANPKEPYLYEPLYHRLLQDVSWDATEQFGETLYQKTRVYDSIAASIKDPPDYHDIASYNVNASLLMQKLFSGGFDQTNAKPINQKTGLRGSHTFLVRVDKAPFTFKLTKQDLNAVPGEDTYIADVYRGIELLEEKTIPDDGFTGTEKLKRDPQSTEFTFDNVPPGIYKIIATNKGGDSLITALETNQSKLVIQNLVYAFSTNPMTIYTTYSPMTLTAVQKGFEQTITLNDKIPLDLKNAAQKYVFDLDKLNPGKKPADLNALEIPKTNVVLRAVGYFALSRDQYFDPSIIHTTDLTKISSLDSVKYLLTPVQKAKPDGDWLVSEITIDATSIKRDETNKLYVSLESPGLATSGGKLEIGSFEVGVDIPGIFANKSDKDNTEKSSILSKISAMPKKIGSFFSDTYQKVVSFFVDSFNSIFHKNGEPIKIDFLTETSPQPSPQPRPEADQPLAETPAATPSPTPEAAKTVTVKVLNGGAPAGYAKKYADLIKNAGYINVVASNADSASVSGALITYPIVSEPDVKIIEGILKTEYTIIQKTADDKTTDITVTIGTK
jgi:hypothetical protein